MCDRLCAVQLSNEAAGAKKLAQELERRNSSLTAKLAEQQGQLSATVAGLQTQAQQAAAELQAEREGREDATAAVMKLKRVIEGVQEEMHEAEEAYGL